MGQISTLDKGISRWFEGSDIVRKLLSNVDRVTENAEIYWSRAFRLVKFHEISAVFDGPC